MAGVIFSDQNFHQEVISSKIPVFVDFSAPWCPPCKTIEPLIETLAKEYEGKIIVGKINTDENPQITNLLNVMSLPTIMLYKNGQPIKVLVGAKGKQVYQQTIDEVLNG